MRKIIMVIMVVCMATVSYGQAKVEIGLKGGLNFANIDASNVSGVSYDARTAWHVGAYGLIKIANIGIQPELLYSTQGSELNVDGIQEDLSSDLVYLNIPVMAKLYLPLGLNIQAGPQFGVLVSAEQDSYDPGSGNITKEDVSDQLKNSDISAALGAGWDAPFGLSVSARYLIGLNDINDSGTDSETKNRVLQLSVGWRLFKVGK